MARVIVGLPSLSRGPLLDMARSLGAPVMISANALARWTDEGPVPPGYEFNRLERLIREQTGDNRPPSDAQKRRRIRSWRGWNLAALERTIGLEVNIDSSGFTAMAQYGAFPFTPESYVLDLCSHKNVTRFSSMDLCVEQEICRDRNEVRERISKTIYLNRHCARLADDAGIRHKLLSVIQGATADDYLRCYDALASVIGENVTIGVGSMCRRPTAGADGSVAIVDRLNRELPPSVRLHLFGLKSDSAEMMCSFGDRIESIDSMAYGVRARKQAAVERVKNPLFSKTNAYVADFLRTWYIAQVARMERPRAFAHQPEISFFDPKDRPRTVLDALEMAARSQINELIVVGDLDHEQIIGGRMLEEWVMELATWLSRDVRLTDTWRGTAQLPARLTGQPWFPTELIA